MQTSTPSTTLAEPVSNGSGPVVSDVLCECDCEEFAAGFADTPLGPLAVCYEHSLDLVG